MAGCGLIGSLSEKISFRCYTEVAMATHSILEFEATNSLDRIESNQIKSGLAAPQMANIG